MDNTRCAGCGKVIDEGSKAVRVSSGKVTDGEGSFEESKEWGVLHDCCFERSVESPSMALAKIKKLAKQTTVVSKVKNG